MIVDIERILVSLLQASFPDVHVAASLDVDSIDHLPMIIVRPVDGESVSNAPVGWAFHWRVNLSMLANSHTAAFDLADSVYQAVHGYEDTQARAPGVGYVRAVTDENLPTRTASVTVANNITQFNWQPTITVRPEN